MRAPPRPRLRGGRPARASRAGTRLTPSPSPRSPFVYVGIASFSLALAIGAFCVIYRRARGFSAVPFQVVMPGMVETSTLAGVVSFLSLSAGLWPAFGFLAPLVVATVFMGLTFSLHFLPPI